MVVDGAFTANFMATLSVLVCVLMSVASGGIHAADVSAGNFPPESKLRALPPKRHRVVGSRSFVPWTLLPTCQPEPNKR
jgi:hypothetical protein